MPTTLQRRLSILVLAVASLDSSGCRPGPVASSPTVVTTERVGFPASDATVHVPFELLANCPYVQVKVNGRGPFLFSLDTGSSDSPLATETLGDLGLAPADGAPGTESIEFAFDGGLRVRTGRSKTLSMAGLWPLLGRRFYGILGYDVLKHFVVELDYERDVVTFSKPGHGYDGAEAAVAATMMMGYDPQVPGELVVPGIGSVPAAFTIDTGAGGTVVTTPLVRKYALTERLTRKVPSPGHGVDGREFNDVVGRIDRIRLDGFDFETPLVALSLDADGPLSTGDLGVNVGGNLLRRFTVVIDYPRQKVVLRPNASFGDPFPADASGLVLAASGDDFATIAVRGIVAGSPADEAGMQGGDVIVAIDGRSTREYALWQIQDLFKEAGVERSLVLRRSGKQLEVRLTLRVLV